MGRNMNTPIRNTLTGRRYWRIFIDFGKFNPDAAREDLYARLVQGAKYQ